MATPVDSFAMHVSSTLSPLHEFTRMSWVSDAARNLWMPRLNRILCAWVEVEYLSIVAGIRSCCLIPAQFDQLVNHAEDWARHGLCVLPIPTDAERGAEVQDLESPFSGMRDSKSASFQLVLGSPKDVLEFSAAYHSSDDDGMGELLGHPSCCHRQQRASWVEFGIEDTIWPQAFMTGQPDLDCTSIAIDSSPKTNVLWKCIGARPVPHLPCSFNCGTTLQLAERYIEVGRSSGFEEEMNWLMDILDWPAEWSALHGIAEIKSPVLKVSTRTDVTPFKYTVRYHGNSMPDKSAQGVDFPYAAHSGVKLTDSPSFKQGLLNSIANSTR